MAAEEDVAAVEVVASNKTAAIIAMLVVSLNVWQGFERSMVFLYWYILIEIFGCLVLSCLVSYRIVSYRIVSYRIVS
jgi:hypothetical protein